jgi:hypothetical protein
MSRFACLFLVVVLLLVVAASASARIVSHPSLRFFQDSSYSIFFQHSTPKSQTGIFSNNDPVNQVDPDGRYGKQAWNATVGNPRVQGGLTAAGGVGGILVGVALLAAPEPTTFR